MAQSGIALIAGLGNPGDRYAATRHNAGLWFIEQLQYTFSFRLSHESRFKAEVGTASIAGRQVRIVVPGTFMNLSGESVAPLAAYFRIPPEQLLVVHDELDLQPGVARLKQGGGHGGHNGLRDIVSRLGSREFLRLRIGIGHPGHGSDVSRYVLERPDAHDRLQMESAIGDSIKVMEDVVDGNLNQAMKILHTPPANESERADGI